MDKIVSAITLSYSTCKIIPFSYNMPFFFTVSLSLPPSDIRSSCFSRATVSSAAASELIQIMRPSAGSLLQPLCILHPFADHTDHTSSKHNLEQTHGLSNLHWYLSHQKAAALLEHTALPGPRTQTAGRSGRSGRQLTVISLGPLRTLPHQQIPALLHTTISIHFPPAPHFS